MSKKVLVVSTSIRRGSNSELLAREVERGAGDAGCDVELVSLADRSIGFCRGCLACQKTGSCVIRDDMDGVIGKVRDADSLVFATPIYYYEMSGQMKVFLDRCNPLYVADYRFRDVCLLTTSAEKDEDGVAPDQGVAARAAAGLAGWVECFPKSRLADVLSCGGLTSPNEAAQSAVWRERAYELGRELQGA